MTEREADDRDRTSPSASPRFADRATILASAVRRAVARSHASLQCASVPIAGGDAATSVSPTQSTTTSSGAIVKRQTPTSTSTVSAAPRRYSNPNGSPATRRPTVAVLVGLFAPQFFGEHLRFALVDAECRMVRSSNGDVMNATTASSGWKSGLLESLSCRSLLDQCISPEGNYGALIDTLAPLEDAAAIRALLKCRPLRLLRRSCGGQAANVSDVGAVGPIEGPLGSWELYDTAGGVPQRWLDEAELLPLRPLGSHPRVVIHWSDGQRYEARCFVYLRSVNPATAANHATLEPSPSWSNGLRTQPPLDGHHVPLSPTARSAWWSTTAVRPTQPLASPPRDGGASSHEDFVAAPGGPATMQSPTSPSAVPPSPATSTHSNDNLTGRSGRYTKWLAAIEERHGMAEWDRRAPLEDVVRVVRRLQQAESIDRLSQPKSNASPPHPVTPHTVKVTSARSPSSWAPGQKQRQEQQPSVRGSVERFKSPRASTGNAATMRFATPPSARRQSTLFKTIPTDVRGSLSPPLAQMQPAASATQGGEAKRVSSAWVVSPMQVNDAACDKVCDTFVSEPAMPHFCRFCGTSQEKHRAKKKLLQQQ